MISKIRLKGFPEELVVEDGKRIKNWSRVRRQIDMAQSGLMSLAMELAKQRIKQPTAEKNSGCVEEKKQEGETRDKQTENRRELGNDTEKKSVVPGESAICEFDTSDVDWDSFWK
jgi:hypothetical protein